MLWTFDKRGNLTTEFLDGDSDTAYLYKYYYDNSDRLIRLEEIGDFLCYKISESKRNSVVTNYSYSPQGTLIETNKNGGCCQVRTKYFYENGQLAKKIFINIGCKFHGEVDTTLFSYNAAGKLISEKNRSDDQLKTYRYDDKGQLLMITQGQLNNPSRLYLSSTFSYIEGRIKSEIEISTYGIEDNPPPKTSEYRYSYNDNGTIKRIDEIQDSVIVDSIIYKYE